MISFSKTFLVSSGAALAIAFLPAALYAVTLGHTVKVISDIINGLIPVALALTILIFFWGLAMYLLDAGNSEKKADGIRMMAMGVAAIFVMVSIWGIVGVLQQTFKVDKSKPIVPDPIEQRRSGTVF